MSFSALQSLPTCRRRRQRRWRSAAPGFTYGNSLIHSQTLNSRGLPNRIRDRTSGNVSRLDYSYSYDKHANITSIVDGVDANENRALQYDARDRMTVATAANIYGEEIYDYDVLDNVRRMAAYPNGMGGYVQDYRYQYNANQRLTRIDNETGVQQWGFTHNGLGETLTRAGHSRNWSYQWNAAGRMTQGHLVYGGSTWETYVYDAHGHRTRATRNTGTTRHQIYSRAGQLLYVEDTRDNQRIDYIHLGGKLVAQRSRPLYSSTATVTYHHTDAIQSANVETNTAGNQTERTIRMPYGAPYDGLYREGPGFAGHVTDTQTNLTYMQQRYYDPVALRFLSPDPVDVSGTDGSNFNRYWYANDNPYKYRDPDGRFVQLIWGAVAGAAVEVFVQTAIEGRSVSEIDVSNVVVAAGAGAVTGGVASASALAAARGTVSVGTAVARTSATAGAMGTVGSVAEDIANGESPSATKAVVEGTAAALGGAAGSRLTLAPLATLESMSAKGGMAAAVADTTRSGIGGSTKSVTSASTSAIGGKVGEAANTTIEATKTKLQDEYNR